jgi:hypothetical protein
MGRRCYANAVDADANAVADINISMTASGRHGDNGGGNVVALVVGWRDESGQRKAQLQRSEREGGLGDNCSGAQKTCPERAIRSGWCDESGRDEGGVAEMMTTAMSSRGRRAVDDATSQTAGRRTMR